MSFLTPLALLGLLISIPIILLYMLRLRRREVVISSTFLWQQVLQDNEANTPWQRLRRNLLLFLQLLILALLVLALARPFITVPSVTSGQTALLIDASISMSATDTDEGTRFDTARREALAAVETLGDGNTMTVIRVGAVPEVLAPYTADRDRLRAAINAAQPDTGQADWLAALTLAAAGGANVEDFSVVIISDGGLGDGNNLPEISLPGDVSFIQVGQSSQNVALSALATRTVPGQPPQLFTQITNYGDQDAEIVFSLRADDNEVPVVSDRYTVPANGTLPIVSSAVLTDNVQTLQASITRSVNSPSQDYLTADNNAFAITRAANDRTVLIVTDGNLFLEQVLRSLPGLESFRATTDQALPSRPFDLYIFDNTVPDELPDGDLFFINPPTSTSLFTVGAETERVGDVTLAEGDPRLAFVDFEDVSILRFNQIVMGDWSDTLIAAQAGPLLSAGEIDGRQVAVLSFDLRQSDLPLQITWPVLVANLMEWFTPSDVLVTTGSLNVGDPVVIRPPFEADAVSVTLPDGTEETLPLERDTVLFTDTMQTGLYTLDVLSGAEVIRSQAFAVNLFAPEESAIAPQQVTVGGQVVLGESEEELGQREFWPIIALLALLVLLIEWWAYHRRLRVPTLFGSGRRRLQPAPVR